MSEVMRHNMPAQQIQVDLTGVKQLILKTWGTENGTGWDHAVWGNAKLITGEGKEVWLSEMQPVMVQAPYGCPFYDRNFNNQKLTVNGKSYEHGMMLHADGMVAYQLDGKYKKFEAEIGIDDAGTEESSVVFRVQNVDGNEILTRLAPKYGKEINAFAAQAGFSPADWLVTPDASLEMGAVRKLIRNFPEKQYYESRLAALEQMTGTRQIETGDESAEADPRGRAFSRTVAMGESESDPDGTGRYETSRFERREIRSAVAGNRNELSTGD